MSERFAIQIRGTGAYVPAEILDNDFFAGYLDTSDEWIVTRTGIRQRRRAAAHESTSTLARDASLRALEDAGLKATELDAIIVATAPRAAMPSQRVLARKPTIASSAARRGGSAEQ